VRACLKIKRKAKERRKRQEQKQESIYSKLLFYSLITILPKHHKISPSRLGAKKV
jgi:hypothetical protein